MDVDRRRKQQREGQHLMQVWLDDELWKQLGVLAAEHGTQRTEMLRRMIREQWQRREENNGSR